MWLPMIRSHAQCMSDWQSEGEKVVLLEAENDEMMMNLSSLASEIGLVTHECRDAGRTEVDAGALTVLAIGPDIEDLINAVTGFLTLY